IIFILGAATGTEHKPITSTVISHGYLKQALTSCEQSRVILHFWNTPFADGFYSGARMFLAMVYESTSFSSTRTPIPGSSGTSRVPLFVSSNSGVVMSFLE